MNFSFTNPYADVPAHTLSIEQLCERFDTSIDRLDVNRSLGVPLPALGFDVDPLDSQPILSLCQGGAWRTFQLHNTMRTNVRTTIINSG